MSAAEKINVAPSWDTVAALCLRQAHAELDEDGDPTWAPRRVGTCTHEEVAVVFDVASCGLDRHLRYAIQYRWRLMVEAWGCEVLGSTFQSDGLLDDDDDEVLAYAVNLNGADADDVQQAFGDAVQCFHDEHMMGIGAKNRGVIP